MPAGGRAIISGPDVRARLRSVACRIIRRIRQAHRCGIVLVPVMLGARRVSRDLAASIHRIDPQLRISVCPLRIRRTVGEHLTDPRPDRHALPTVLWRNRVALVIDDLVDQGETLALAERIVRRHSRSRPLTLVLVQKRRHRSGRLAPDYVCFRLRYSEHRADQRWLFGYGMDYRGRYRNCDFVGEVDVGRSAKGGHDA